MKNLKLLFMAAILTVGLFAACSAADKYQRNINKLETLITELENDEDITSEDWEKASETIQSLEIDEEQLKNMTEEQAEEYGKLMGRYAKVALQQGIKQSGDAIEKAGSLLNGILEGLGADDTEEEENSEE